MDEGKDTQKAAADSIRLPEETKSLLALIAKKRKRGEKITDVHRLSLLLGLQIQVAFLWSPGEQEEFAYFTGDEIAREISPFLRSGSEFCNHYTYPAIPVPSEIGEIQKQMHHLEQLLEEERNQKQQANLQLYHLQTMLEQVLRTGLILQVPAPDPDFIQVSPEIGGRLLEEDTIFDVDTIEVSEDAATRLNIGAGIEI